MNKLFLKQLIIASYKNGELDRDNVMKIADKLNRQELKKYLQALKISEKLRTVLVETPLDEDTEMQRNIKNLFPDRRVQYRKNADLLVGTRIFDNDDVIEMNLKDSLESIVENLGENYD